MLGMWMTDRVISLPYNRRLVNLGLDGQTALLAALTVTQIWWYDQIQLSIGVISS